MRVPRLIAASCGHSLSVRTRQMHPDPLLTRQDWIPDTVWLEIVALSAMDALRDLPDSVVRNDAAWHTW